MKILFFKKVMWRGVVFIGLIILSSSCVRQLQALQNQRKMLTSPYEQMTFVDLMRRYVSKENSTQSGIEGIYSVSIIVLKKSKPLFSSEMKEKEVERKENYAQVAIIRDNAKHNREYVEIPLDKSSEPSYPVRGEFTTMSDGNVLVMKHFEPKSRTLSYQFAYDHDKQILEGISTEISGSVTYTYKMTYVKLYPKPPARQQ